MKLIDKIKCDCFYLPVKCDCRNKEMKYTYKLFNGKCQDEMGGLDDNSIDTIITDPPY